MTEDFKYSLGFINGQDFIFDILTNVGKALVPTHPMTAEMLEDIVKELQDTPSYKKHREVIKQHGS